MRAPLIFEKAASTDGRPRRIAQIGKTTASNGSTVNFPVGSEKGTRCAPRKSQADVRMGSAVLPVVLPATAQAKSEIKASGKSVKATLRRACLKETPRARAIIF